MTPLDQALAYAERWPVFPTGLIPRSDGTFDKVPLVKWAKDPKDRAAVDARDPVTIARWWLRWPDAAISIPTGARSGVIVLDIDVKKGRNGFDTLADLGKSILPDTPIAHTPSGGVHVYFACNKQVEIRNSAGVKGLGTGLDVRGDGGQVVLPGPGGYWWDPHANFDTLVPMPAPAWLGRRPPKQRNSSTSGRAGRFDPQAFLGEACRRIRTAPDGTKHDTIRQETFRVATLVRDRLLTEHEARHALEAEIMPIGMRYDGDTAKVAGDYHGSFAEGLAAPARRPQR
jgi:hypothetical protein